MIFLFKKTNQKGSMLNLNATKIVWPGNTFRKPEGTKWSSKLKIVVIEEEPFIFKRLKPKNIPCNEINSNSTECPWSYSNFIFLTLRIFIYSDKHLNLTR